MTYLLDTNVLSEVRKPSPHDAVTRWFASVRSADLFLSVLVIGEIRRGIEQLRPRDGSQAHAYELWLDQLKDEFRDRLLPVTESVADEWGRLNAARTRPALDGLIAATAKMAGLTLVTRNVRDFADTGIRLLNPFEPQS